MSSPPAFPHSYCTLSRHAMSPTKASEFTAGILRLLGFGAVAGPYSRLRYCRMTSHELISWHFSGPPPRMLAPRPSLGSRRSVAAPLTRRSRCLLAPRISASVSSFQRRLPSTKIIHLGRLQRDPDPRRRAGQRLLMCFPDPADKAHAPACLMSPDHSGAWFHRLAARPCAPDSRHRIQLLRCRWTTVLFCSAPAALVNSSSDFSCQSPATGRLGHRGDCSLTSGAWSDRRFTGLRRFCSAELLKLPQRQVGNVLPPDEAFITRFRWTVDSG